MARVAGSCCLSVDALLDCVPPQLSSVASVAQVDVAFGLMPLLLNPLVGLVTPVCPTCGVWCPPPCALATLDEHVNGYLALAHLCAHIVRRLCVLNAPWRSFTAGAPSLRGVRALGVVCAVSVAPWFSFTGVRTSCVACLAAAAPWCLFTGVHTVWILYVVFMTPWSSFTGVRALWFVCAVAVAPGRSIRGVCTLCFVMRCPWLSGACSRVCVPCRPPVR